MFRNFTGALFNLLLSLDRDFWLGLAILLVAICIFVGLAHSASEIGGGAWAGRHGSVTLEPESDNYGHVPSSKKD